MHRYSIVIENFAHVHTIGLSSVFKIQFNSFFQEAYNDLKELEKHFSHISASHVKSHTGQTSIFATLNNRVDSLAKACNSGFLRTLTSSDRENTPLT